MGMWSLFQLSLSSQPLLYAFSIALMILLCVPRLAGLIMQSIGKSLSLAVLLIVIIDFSLNYVEMIEPITRMVLLLAFFRALQYRTRREDLQLLLLALFMLILAGVLTVSLLFAVQMILFSPLAMGLLFLANLLDHGQQKALTTDDWKDFHWGPFIARVTKGLDTRMLLFAGGLFVAVVAVSTCIFVMLPRFNMGQNLSFMQLHGSGKKGFSDQITFGDVNELADDDAVALRVEPPNRESIPATPYWRMITLDEYRNGSFLFSMSARTSGLQTRTASTYTARFADTDLRPEQQHPDQTWVFYLEGNVSRFLPFPGPFAAARFPQNTKFNAFPELNLIELNQVSNNVFGYSVTGMFADGDIPASEQEIRELKHAKPFVPTLNEEGKVARVNYPMTTLALPMDAEDRAYLNRVLEEITDGQQLDLAEFQQRVFAYLHTRYRYDTSLGDLTTDAGSDPLLHWMRNAQTGWCEHFTGAFIVLARMAGFPARAVTGFTGATWNDFEDYLLVRNNNAHAWVEVFDAQTLSWRRVDPTPQASEALLQATGALASTVATDTGMHAWLDSLRMVWYRRVVNFDEGDQTEMARGLRDFGASFFQDIKKAFVAGAERLEAWLHSGWNLAKIVQVLAVCVFMVLLGYAAKYFNRAVVFFWNLQHRNDRRHRGSLHPLRRKAGKWLLRLQPLRNQPSASDAGQTLEQIYARLLALRYDVLDPSHEAHVLFKQARQVLKKYKSKLE